MVCDGRENKSFYGGCVYSIRGLIVGLENADVYMARRKYEIAKKNPQYSCAESDLGLPTSSTCMVAGKRKKDGLCRDRDCLCSTRYHYAILTQMPASMTMLGTTHAMMSEDAARCPGGGQRRDNDGDGDYTSKVRGVTRRYHARSLRHQPRSTTWAWCHNLIPRLHSVTPFHSHVPHSPTSFS